MSFRENFYSFLSGNLIKPEAVTSNVGSVQNGYLVYQRIVTTQEYAHDGHLGLITARYQFDAYADKKQDALLIIEELKTLLDDYVGNMGETKVQGVFIVNEFDTFDSGSDLFREEIEFNIQYYK